MGGSEVTSLKAVLQRDIRHCVTRQPSQVVAGWGPDQARSEPGQLRQRRPSWVCFAERTRKPSWVCFAEIHITYRPPEECGTGNPPRPEIGFVLSGDCSGKPTLSGLIRVTYGIGKIGFVLQFPWVG